MKESAWSESLQLFCLESWKHAMAIITFYSLHPNTSEVHFCWIQFKRKHLCSFDPAKCIFLQFQRKIVFAFLMKESCNQRDIAIKRLPLISFLLHHLHEVLSQQSQRSQFAEILNTCGSRPAALFRLLRAFIVKISSSLSLKIHLVQSRL